MDRTDPDSLDARRHAAQLAFVASGAELELGSPADSPLSPEWLAQIDEHAPEVVQRFGGGLTAQVFRIRAGGRDWTLKRARRPALVKNVDGQTSFLNEIQRRADFRALKAAGTPGLAAIVDTTYASLRRGVMLSPWLDGSPVHDWDERRLVQWFEAAVACHAAGLFDWDPSPGNVLDDGRQLRLFDFGYMYRFDPLRAFNTAGRGDDQPMFHPAERLETRNLSGRLLEIERARGAAAALRLFRLEKQVAVEAYRRLRAGLAARGARADVCAWLDAIVARWSGALAGDLDTLYLAEGWRSHVLDLDDDLRGQTCTPMTLARADWLLDALGQHHGALLAAGALFGEDRGRSAAALTAHYRLLRRRAEGLQVAEA